MRIHPEIQRRLKYPPQGCLLDTFDFFMRNVHGQCILERCVGEFKGRVNEGELLIGDLIPRVCPWVAPSARLRTGEPERSALTWRSTSTLFITWRIRWPVSRIRSGAETTPAPIRDNMTSDPDIVKAEIKGS